MIVECGGKLVLADVDVEVGARSRIFSTYFCIFKLIPRELS